ncbi:MAG: hypothetical protein WBM98_01600 [Maribacter sp.]|uniref:hypothetical protein n=1 Tax=Maribacter sp. TaxID=1897614 RepID=UPI003C759EBB
MKLTLRLRILLTGIVTLLVWSHVAWDYFHGGVPTHYLLHDSRLPGISNWWGAAILPFFTWFLLYRIHKRIDLREMSVATESLSKIVIRFLAAVLVAVAIAVCFMNDIEVTDYIMGSLFILAFFFPLYKSEYLLGWVLGAAFTFGAIIPMGFGSLLALIFFIFYQLGKTLFGFFRSKTK